MKIEIVKKANANCNVSKLGFCYPLIIHNKYSYNDAVNILRQNKNFGDPAKELHYISSSHASSPPVIRYLYTNSDIQNRKWFAGPKRWGSNAYKMNGTYWIVFKEEKLRNIALLLISK